MQLHRQAFRDLDPDERHRDILARMEAAAQNFADAIQRDVPECAQRMRILRLVLDTHQWIRYAVLHHDDGSPRTAENP